MLHPWVRKSRILDVLSQFWAFWQMWADCQNHFIGKFM